MSPTGQYQITEDDVVDLLRQTRYRHLYLGVAALCLFAAVEVAFVVASQMNVAKAWIGFALTFMAGNALLLVASLFVLIWRRLTMRRRMARIYAGSALARTTFQVTMSDRGLRIITDLIDHQYDWRDFDCWLPGGSWQPGDDHPATDSNDNGVLSLRITLHPNYLVIPTAVAAQGFDLTAITRRLPRQDQLPGKMKRRRRPSLIRRALGAIMRQPGKVAEEMASDGQPAPITGEMIATYQLTADHWLAHTEATQQRFGFNNFFAIAVLVGNIALWLQLLVTGSVDWRMGLVIGLFLFHLILVGMINKSLRNCFSGIRRLARLMVAHDRLDTTPRQLAIDAAGCLFSSPDSRIRLPWSDVADWRLTRRLVLIKDRRSGNIHYLPRSIAGSGFDLAAFTDRLAQLTATARS